MTQQQQQNRPEDFLGPSEDLLAYMTQQQQQSPPEDLATAKTQEQQTPQEDFLAFMSQQQQPGTGGLLALPGLGEEEEEEDGGAALPPSPPWWRRRGVIIALILLILFGLGSYFLIGILTRKPQVTFTTQTVTPGNLAQTITATGPLQGATYNINFKGTGTIAQIDVVVGQHVNKGQVVAKLDPVSLQDAVNTAQAAYNAALATLQSDLANSGATQGQGGANISAAQTTLSNAQANLNRVEAQGRASVAAAQTTLTNTQAQMAATEAQGQANIAAAQTTLTNAEAQLSAAQAQAQAQINTAQATETSTIDACPTSMAVTAANTDASMDTATEPDGDSDDAAVAAALQNCRNVAITTFNQAVATANTSVTTAQAAVNSAQAGVTTAQGLANTNDTNAQAAVNAAQAGVTTAQRNANLNNTTALSQVSAAQKALNTAIASANLSDTSSNGLVSGAESSAQSALTALNTAQHNLQNATLTTPNPGIVTVINGTVGGTPGVPANVSTSITGTSGTFIQIVDSTTLQAVANVNESDTTNLKVGDTAQFTVAAYGSREFTGVVAAISPNGTTVSNVVTFPVYVNVDKTDLQGATLLPGMTANLTINVAERIGVRLIPVNAVNFARSATVASAATGGVPLITLTQETTATTQAQTMLQQLLAQNPSITSDNPTPAFVLEQPSPGQVKAIPIVIGLTDGTNYEVLSTNPKAGEMIITGVRAGRGGGGGGGGFRGGPGAA